ncbi:MAG: hypothetical protein AB4042_18310 [Leptolyngbyaceae cyanobacterium]
MSYSKRHLLWVLSLITTAAILILTAIAQGSVAQESPTQSVTSQSVTPQSVTPQSVTTESIQQHLPPARSHSLPASLSHWSEGDETDTYFEQIEPTPFGYLVWSQFPVRVYLTSDPSTRAERVGSLINQDWLAAVQGAIAEWSAYLPLLQTDLPEAADITIVAQTPTLRWGERARTAETTYTLRGVTAGNGQQMIQQHYRILLSPNQTRDYLLATARHELGHALGIWGHSLRETDALYRSQVSNPPLISTRDVNTLKEIYQQPTQLGWPLLNLPTAQPQELD